MKKCRLIFFFTDLALRLLFIDLHFFIATIQIGVIVQVCYTLKVRWLSDLFNRVPNIRILMIFIRVSVISYMKK